MVEYAKRTKKISLTNEEVHELWQILHYVRKGVEQKGGKGSRTKADDLAVFMNKLERVM